MENSLLTRDGIAINLATIWTASFDIFTARASFANQRGISGSKIRLSAKAFQVLWFSIPTFEVCLNMWETILK